MFRHLMLSLVLLLLVLFPGQALALLDYGDVAPDFGLESLHGETIHLSDFKGRVVVLKLATTWCPTCLQQTQEINDARDFLDEHGVVVIEVFLQDTVEMVNEYLDGKPHPRNYYPVMDDGQARNAYNVYLIPRTLIVDAERKVRRDGSLIGALDLKQLVKAALPEGGR